MGNFPGHQSECGVEFHEDEGWSYKSGLTQLKAPHQGLKPSRILSICGMTEVMPCYKPA
jgi:hypothetical protein